MGFRLHPAGCSALVLMLIACSCSEDKPTKSDPPTLSLTKSSQLFEPARTYQVALGDFDDDGDLDAVFSNMADISSTVWLNDGAGFFTNSGQSLTQWGHGVGVGDLDGDEDLDLFITCASESHRSRVYFNDGYGTFTDSGQNLGDTATSGNGVQLADVDSDGDLDALVVYYERPDKIYLNDGDGTFTDSGLVLNEGAVCGYLDGDDDVDLFVKDYGSGYRSMLNDGHGNFSDRWQMEDTSCVYGGVSIADLDGDGDEDAVICNGDHTGNHPTKILLNDGTGEFFDTGQELEATNWGRLGVGDLNGDGTPDAFVSNFGLPNQVWLNEGSGSFIDGGMTMSGDLSDNTTYVALGDLDNDGDLDVFVANFAEGRNEIWFSGK